MQICDRSLCTGCSACSCVCPHGCIRMIRDSDGFWRPEIDEVKCVNCRLCQRFCPTNNHERIGEDTYDNIHPYAYINQNEAVLQESSSGGAFSTFAEYIISHSGIIFGAAYGIILQKKFQKKYLVDIRDFTLENFKLFQKLEKRVIDNSYATVISSNGYKSFLPEYPYVIAHNYTPVNDVTVQKIKNHHRSGNCINISFIGYVRFYDMAKKLLLLFKNDERFHLSYIGTGANVLAPFCKENQIENVTLHGQFSPNQTAEFYMSCDLINNLYGNHNPYLDHALSNKLYYAAQFQIPVLVSKDTYSCQVAEENHLGIAWDPDVENAADMLYDQFCAFDYQKMQKSSDAFLNKVVNENQKFSQMIKQFLKE